MKTKDFILKFIIAWMLTLTFIFVIITNNRTQNLHQKINNLQDTLLLIKKNNQTVSDTLTQLNKELEKYKLKTEILQSEKDSIILSLKKSNISDYQKLQIIKKQQKELNKKLKELRILNLKFE